MNSHLSNLLLLHLPIFKWFPNHVNFNILMSSPHFSIPSITVSVLAPKTCLYNYYTLFVSTTLPGQMFLYALCWWNIFNSYGFHVKTYVSYQAGKSFMISSLFPSSKLPLQTLPCVLSPQYYSSFYCDGIICFSSNLRCVSCCQPFVHAVLTASLSFSYSLLTFQVSGCSLL